MIWNINYGQETKIIYSTKKEKDLLPVHIPICISLKVTAIKQNDKKAKK